MPNWCELLSPEKNIGEMQKMHLMQMLQPVITIEVAEVHSAVYVGNPRLLGRTDRGCFCLEYVIRNRWIALDVKKPLNAVNKNLTKE